MATTDAAENQPSAKDNVIDQNDIVAVTMPLAGNSSSDDEGFEPLALKVSAMSVTPHAQMGLLLQMMETFDGDVSMASQTVLGTANLLGLSADPDWPRFRRCVLAIIERDRSSSSK